MGELMLETQPLLLKEGRKVIGNCNFPIPKTQNLKPNSLLKSNFEVSTVHIQGFCGFSKNFHEKTCAAI
jgi:hypothetical protein